MIGLDTNVLVRYFAQDDVQQSKRATQIIENELTKDNVGFISCIVLLEVYWVLGRIYNVKKEARMKIVMALLHAEDLQMEHREEIWKAHKLVTSQRLDFADALLGLIHISCGCEYTLTFDKKALGHEIFKSA